MSLMITVSDLDKIVRGQIARFSVEFNDLPMYMPGYKRSVDDTHRKFIEDDGREYRVLIFKDNETGKVYNLNYVYHSEFGNEYGAFDGCEGLTFVKDPKQSDLYVEDKKAETIKELEPVVQEQKNLADKLKAQYYEMEGKEKFKLVKSNDVIQVPVSVINDLKSFMKTKKFNLYELQARIFKICIDYKLEQKSFWQWFQIKIGNWKLKK